MQVEALKEGLVRVKPLKEKSNSVIIIIEDAPIVLKRGVVQSIGTMTPQECGFIEGDMIYYTDPLKFMVGSELVSLENIVLTCEK